MNYYRENGLCEKDLIEWSKQFCRTDKTMLDIGAHTGTYTISLAEYCSHVYAFEPQKMTFYALCGGVALSNIRNATCIPVGLGSEDQVGPQTLHIISVDGGGSSLQMSSEETLLEKETVKIRTLDSFGLTNIGFIKMDVENNEFHVLKGALQTLENSFF